MKTLSDVIKATVLVFSLMVVGCGDGLSVGDSVRFVDGNEKYIIVEDGYDNFGVSKSADSSDETISVNKSLVVKWEDKTLSSGFQKIQQHDNKFYYLVELPTGVTVIDGKVYDLREQELSVDEILQLAKTITKSDKTK